MSLTITTPYRDTLIDAVECYYFAAFNSINFIVQRKDFDVIDTQDDGSGNTQINVTGTLPTLTVYDPVTDTGYIYANIGTFGSGLIGPCKVLGNSASAVIVDIPFTSTLTGGFINLTTDRKDYAVATRVQPVIPTILNSYGIIPYIRRRYTPSSHGEATIDVAEQMRGKFQLNNTFDYLTSAQDEANCILYTVEFLETWQGSAESYSTQYLIGAVNAAMQVQNKGGSNMHLYMPTEAAGDKAKFLLDSNTLRYWEGLPFSIDSIYGPDVVNGAGASTIFTREELFTGTTSVGVVNTAIAPVSAGDILIRRHVLQGGYGATIESLKFSLLYSPATVFTSETTVRIEHEIPCNPVYLRWKNKKGGMHFFCFSGDQIVGRKTTSEGKFEPYFRDLEDQYATTIELARESERWMKCGSDRLDGGDMALMESLFEASQVWLLQNTPTWASLGPVWQLAIVDPGDKELFHTKRRSNPFEFKIFLPKVQLERN